MGRPAGRRNQDYERARAALGQSARAQVLEPGGAQATRREREQCAGVSVATLRHYCPARESLVEAVLAEIDAEGARYIQAAVNRTASSLEDSLLGFLQGIAVAWKVGAGRAHAFGLTVGLSGPALGKSYVQHLLEPTLRAAEARLARHVADGELPRCDVRHAALELVSPPLLALLHQESLCGVQVRPLDVPGFLAEHVHRFITAHAGR